MSKLGDGLKDLYDSERKAVRAIKDAVQLRHCYRGMSSSEEEANMRAFTNEIVNRCAEIGLVVDVLWDWEDEKKGTRSPDVSDDPEDNNLYFYPKVIVTDRIEALGEYDHDRQKHEVQSGLLDGKAGVIRENGEFREDSIRKNFYT